MRVRVRLRVRLQGGVRVGRRVWVRVRVRVSVRIGVRVRVHFTFRLFVKPIPLSRYYKACKDRKSTRLNSSH